jgi:predicted FMN-binding regulatory protein PaiB
MLYEGITQGLLDFDYAPNSTLVSQDNGHPCATHVPLRFEPKSGTHGSLFGHVARANAQGLLLQPDRETLAIFHGPHAYVSPTLYAQHPAVPTWHHVTVHATGFPRVLVDRDEILRHLAALVGERHLERSDDSCCDIDQPGHRPDRRWNQCHHQRHGLHRCHRRIVRFDLGLR